MSISLPRKELVVPRESEKWPIELMRLVCLAMNEWINEYQSKEMNELMMQKDCPLSIFG